MPGLAAARRRAGRTGARSRRGDVGGERRERDERASRGHAELAVDAAGMRPHRLHADVQLERDARVRVALAEEVQHVGLAPREERVAEACVARMMGAAGHDLQPARGEVDRVADVAGLRVLGETRAGAEGEQLRAFRGRQVLPEQHEPRVGMLDG